MLFKSRLPVPENASSSHPLNRMRSESYLSATPERALRHLRSMGQLSPAPDWPLPPVPPRSPLRPTDRACGITGPSFLHGQGVQQNPQYSPSTSSSSSGSHYSQNDGLHCFGRNTMLIQEQSDQKKIEFTLRRNSKQTPNLDDLSNMLQLRGRLQEMGTTFTPEGSMLTYGNPPLNADLEQMLYLGAWYSEQWNMFFNSDAVPEEPESDLWADLKVLRKMLQNEGISFDEDDHHTRLNYGTAHPKLIRLSDQYDVLRDEWLHSMMQNVHPAERPRRRRIVQEMPTTPTNLGWDFLYDEEDGDRGRKTNRRDSRLTIVVEEQQQGSGPESTIREGEWFKATVYPSPPITPESLASGQGIADEEKPTTTADDPVVITRARGRTVGAPALLHGSSPLQVASTASMLLRDAASETRVVRAVSEANQVSQNEVNQCREDGRPHAGVLALLIEDEQRRADERQRVVMPPAHLQNNKNKKGKGVRKWLRAVLGRRKNGER